MLSARRILLPFGSPIRSVNILHVVDGIGTARRPSLSSRHEASAHPRMHTHSSLCVYASDSHKYIDIDMRWMRIWSREARDKGDSFTASIHSSTHPLVHLPQSEALPPRRGWFDAAPSKSRQVVEYGARPDGPVIPGLNALGQPPVSRQLLS